MAAVVNERADAPGLIPALLRNVLIGDALPAFYIVGAMLIARPPEKRRLGDPVAGHLQVPEVKKGADHDG